MQAVMREGDMCNTATVKPGQGAECVDRTIVCYTPTYTVLHDTACSVHSDLVTLPVCGLCIMTVICATVRPGPGAAGAVGS